MPSLVTIGPQIKQKRGGGGQNVYILLNYPSLNRVKEAEK